MKGRLFYALPQVKNIYYRSYTEYYTYNLWNSNAEKYNIPQKNNKYLLNSTLSG